MLFLLLFFTECERNPDKDSFNKNLTYIKTESGGCNGKLLYDLRSTGEENKDTVIFSNKKDTLDVFVGINYICCAPFTDKAIISNDSIILTLTDGCSNPYITCYCRCVCYYTWDFLFDGFKEKVYCFKIILHNPQIEKPIILGEGKVDLSEKK